MKNRLIKLCSLAIATGVIFAIGSTSLAAPYTVVKGDSLWKIAKNKLGDGNRYVEIYEANKDQIKNPAKIQIGQVLQIPDVVSGATTTKPEEAEVTTPAPAPEMTVESDSLPTFRQFLGTSIKNAANNFDDFKVGEEITDEIEYATVSYCKTEGGVLATKAIVKSEKAINSCIENFFYEHGNAYQSVFYLTKKDGGKTIFIMNHSKDGTENKLIYASTDNNETADTEINISDIISGGQGKVKIQATKDEGTGITNKVSEIITEDTVRRTNYIQVKEDGNVKTVKANSLNKDKTEITNLTFETTYNGDNQTEVVSITDVEGIGTLSFDSNKDGVILSSAKYVEKTTNDAIGRQRNADLISSLEELKVGKEVNVNYNGAQQFIKKIADNVVYSEIKPKNGNIITDIVFKYGQEFIKLDISDFVKDGISTVSLHSIKKDGPNIPLYYTTSDDTIGEKTIELATVGTEKVELKTKVTENADRSRSKEVQFVIDGKVALTSTIEISADGNKVETVSKIGEAETKLNFLINGKTVTTTIIGKDGECVLTYDRDDNKRVCEKFSVN